MIDMMQKTINRNLLKYSAGRAIFCPHCDNVADYRRWMIAEDDTGKIVWQGCTDCGKPLMDVGYIITMEPQPNPRKAPKLPDSVMVRSIGGGKLESIPCAPAFEMYGDTFVAHPSISLHGFWTITHVLTGAAACNQSEFKSKAAAIRAARENLERIGSDGFAKAKALAMPKGN